MNIIIPLGGKGERFTNCGYVNPKPLIKIMNEEMIFYVIDNLTMCENDNIFIIYLQTLDNYMFSDIIKFKYPQVHFIPLTKQTSGAVETLYNGIQEIIRITNHKKCVLLDCDTFYTYDILSVIRGVDTNMVFFTNKHDESPIYSYITMDETNKITNIREKEKISPCANTGCYVFNNIELLNMYCKYVLDNNITFRGEPYTSCVISQMIMTHDFYGYELNNKSVFSLGTPTDVANFINRSFVFLFDLDGTIVNTDRVYFKVWSSILSEYNIELTTELFNAYIQGNTDDKVIASLLPGRDIGDISKVKDKLFMDNITEIQIIDGVVDFIKTVKSRGYACSIVTNGNRIAAEKVTDYCQIRKYMDYITVGGECNRPKPYPDPYTETIAKYNLSNDKFIIFEDSKTGLLSARLSNVRCVVGIESNYDSNELIRNGANLTIHDYTVIQIDDIVCYKTTMVDIERYVKQTLQLNINQVIIDDTKLKGGYISDVIAMKIITDTDEFDCVLKLENQTETSLSLMAKKLGLYERENYFYDAMSRYVNVSCPKFYGLVRDDNLNTIGILMENLNVVNTNRLNLNLNNENINISLRVIDNLVKLHSQFWNKNIQNAFPQLKKHNDVMFNPVWDNFINDRWNTFIQNWQNVLTTKQIEIANTIKRDFPGIQQRLSDTNLTVIHGDVKSPNLFYDANNAPIFLDWQYVAIGKGAQDLVFFLIESFDIYNIKLNFPIFKNYYYKQLITRGITNYSFDDYERDFNDAVCYFPFFVAVWFGSTPRDDLIDKNFPFFFIQKLFFLLEELC